MNVSAKSMSGRVEAAPPAAIAVEWRLTVIKTNMDTWIPGVDQVQVQAKNAPQAHLSALS